MFNSLVFLNPNTLKASVSEKSVLIQKVEFSIGDIIPNKAVNLSIISKFKQDLLFRFLEWNVDTLTSIAFANAIGHVGYFFKDSKTKALRKEDLQLIVDSLMKKIITIPSKPRYILKKNKDNGQVSFISAKEVNYFSACIAELGQDLNGLILNMKPNSYFKIPTVSKVKDEIFLWLPLEYQETVENYFDNYLSLSKSEEITSVSQSQKLEQTEEDLICQVDQIKLDSVEVKSPNTEKFEFPFPLADEKSIEQILDDLTI
jgi:hypothetical protein